MAGGDPQAGAILGSPVRGDQSQVYQSCLARYAPDLGWVAFLVVVAVALASARSYRLLPWWRTTRPGVVPVELVDPELAGRMAQLQERAGLPVGLTVRFLVAVTACGTGAVVYGTAHRPVVRLDGGLVVAARRAASRERFEAVILHELAHAANRDVGITYATVAVWRVFLVVVLLPELAMSGYLIATQRTPASWQLQVGPEMTLVLAVVIGALVYLLRSDVLRVREVCADRTAVEHGAVPAALVPHDVPSGPVSGPRRLVPAALALWRTHPSWARRALALERPEVLFRPAPGVVPGRNRLPDSDRHRRPAPAHPLGDPGGADSRRGTGRRRRRCSSE